MRARERAARRRPGVAWERVPAPVPVPPPAAVAPPAPVPVPAPAPIGASVALNPAVTQRIPVFADEGSDQPGERFGQYTLLERIAVGGIA